MRNLVLVFLLFISVWIVNSQKEPTPLTSGDAIQGTLPALFSENGQYDLDLYSIFIPENATSLNLTFTNGNLAQCGKLHLFLRTFGLPCNTEQYNETYLCANGWDVVDFGSSDDDDDDDDDDADDARAGNVNRLLLPSQAKNQWDFAVNQNTYLGIGRSTPNTYNIACTYTLTASVRAPCAIGQVGTYRRDVECSNYIEVDNFNQTYSQSFNPGETTSFRIYKLTIPPNTANLTVVLNSTFNRNSIEGKSYSVPGDENNCEISRATNRSGSYYFYYLVCYVPSAGDFYITVDTRRNEFYSAQVNFSINICGNDTAGGQCEYPLTLFSLDQLNNTQSLNETTNSNSTTTNGTNTNTNSSNSNTVVIDLPDPLGFSYWYLNIPDNFTRSELSIQVTPQQRTGRVRVRNNAPYYDDGSDDDENDDYTTLSYATPVTIHINQYDWAVPKRIYLAFSCASRRLIDFCRFNVTTTFA